MKGILYAQLKLLIRNPATFLIMTGICILFAFFIGSSSGTYQSYIPIYSEMEEKETEQVLSHLQQYGAQNYELVEKEVLEKEVREGSAEAGLFLFDDHYEIVIASKTGTFTLLEQNIQKAYGHYLQEKQLKQADNVNGAQLIKQLNEPMFTVETKTFFGEDSFIYDSKLQAIFGFAVFFVIYTIAFNVIHILVAKQEGIWDRIILSPSRKWEMYVGILCYAFFLGYIQVVIVFSFFRYALGVNFYDGFGNALLVLIPYVLAIVSLSVLIAGISKTTQTFNAIIPIVSVSFAMIGGSYWPIEIVTSKFMLALSKIDPVTYVMDALKAVTIYGEPISGALFPISILVLMSVVMMGVGINLMERRS
ncbi:ABC-2 type transport system permease protein [Salirhabdus euzebyi]|uniref:ABC-2 type transport system permease protein n=1 Tax=Salirhabdus euzebyi TaxID=394506 RepID=A0A841QA03_9BACI|nr:ABC transporter permease [Salirhabdus euzebyi]MBB6455067.1 ABC-2 type transport system permease protein [Salirhabdus euzebyi]